MGTGCKFDALDVNVARILILVLVLFVPSVAILSTYFSTKLATAIGIAASGSGLGMHTEASGSEFLLKPSRWCVISNYPAPTSSPNRISLGSPCHRIHRSSNITHTKFGNEG